MVTESGFVLAQRAAWKALVGRAQLTLISAPIWMYEVRCE